jgi:hypothetical protein
MTVVIIIEGIPKRATVLSVLMKVYSIPCHVRGHINVMSVLQRGTDSLQVLPGSSIEMFPTSPDGTCDVSNVKVEEDLNMEREEEVNVKTEEEECIDIKQEDGIYCEEEGVEEENIDTNEDVDIDLKEDVSCDNQVMYMSACLLLRPISTLSINLSCFWLMNLYGQV